MISCIALSETDDETVDVVVSFKEDHVEDHEEADDERAGGTEFLFGLERKGLGTLRYQTRARMAIRAAIRDEDENREKNSREPEEEENRTL